MDCGRITRRSLLTALPAAVAGAAARLAIVDFYSPLNGRRPARPATRYIVLHTTEGEEEGSLRKIRRYGESHYVVAPSGRIYRIIDRNRIATHAGRSMWDGHSNIDHYSIGIEVVGYHNHDFTSAQYGALRELIGQLRRLYAISDQSVLTHSMVAYGRPNRFHRYYHRGRKRCAMILARPDVRARLELKPGPDHDPDVAAGRIRVGDPELQAYLFARALRGSSPVPAAEISVPAESNVIGGNQTAWRIAREYYNRSDTTYIFPDGSRKGGDEISDWGGIPAGTRVVMAAEEGEQEFEGFLEIGKDGNTSMEIAGDAYDAATTIYFFPDGFIRTGSDLRRARGTRPLLQKAPPGTRLLVGYIYGGYVGSGRPASSIAGAKWNYPTTYYRLPDGSIASGDSVDPGAIPAGTLVFFQH